MKTDRLLLRGYRIEDLDDFYAYVSDPEVVRFEPYAPMTRDEAAAELNSRIGSDEFIAVERLSDHRLIGNLYLGRRDFNARELGYVFRRDCWGKGYAHESCSTLIQSAFESGIHRIYAECDPENAASWRLLERLSFVREAHLHKNIYFHTGSDGLPLWKDTFVYAHLAPDVH